VKVCPEHGEALCESRMSQLVAATEPIWTAALPASQASCVLAMDAEVMETLRDKGFPHPDVPPPPGTDGITFATCQREHVAGLLGAIEATTPGGDPYLRAMIVRLLSSVEFTLVALAQNRGELEVRFWQKADEPAPSVAN
jgi:hypothetical protein